MSKDSKDKFQYRNAENLDSVFNYLSMLNKGLKNRHLSFGKDDDLIDIKLPDDVVMSIDADVGRDEGSLSIRLEWDCVDMTEEDEARAKEEKEAAKKAEKAEKAEKKRLKAEQEEAEKAEKKRLKAEKEAAEKAEKAAKKARKAEEKARKEAEKALEAVSELKDDPIDPVDAVPRKAAMKKPSARKTAKSPAKSRQKKSKETGGSR